MSLFSRISLVFSLYPIIPLAAQNLQWVHSLSGWGTVTPTAQGQLYACLDYQDTLRTEAGTVLATDTADHSTALVRFTRQGVVDRVWSFPGASDCKLVLGNADTLFFYGFFPDTTDLDPGPSQYWVPGGYALAVLDSAGSLVRVHHFGNICNSFTGIGAVRPLPGGNYLVAGTLTDTLSLPGYGTVIPYDYFKQGYNDALFLLRFGAQGALLNAQSIQADADTSYASIHGLSATFDLAGNLLLGITLSGTLNADMSGGSTIVGKTGWGGGPSSSVLIKYTPGYQLLWAKTVTGIGENRLHSPALMPNGDLLYTGSFMNTVDADPDSGQVWLVSGGLMNQLVIRLDSMGQYKQAFSLLEDNNRCDMHPGAGVMSLPGNGFAIWGAFCQYVELNPLGTPVNILSNGRSDGLLAVYDSLGVLQHHVLLGGQENDRIQQVIPTDDAVYLAGYFADTVNFDLAGGVSTLANDAYQALFIAKYAQSVLAAAPVLSRQMLVLAPNPAQAGITRLSWSQSRPGQGRICVFDMQGREAISNIHSGAVSGHQEATLRLAGLLGGAYRVVLTYPDGVLGTTLIVKE